MTSVPASPRPLRISWRHGISIFAAAMLLQACGTMHTPPEPRAEPEPPRWQRIRFYIQWNRSDPPQWHVDALLAHRVAAPLLDQERPSIALWRFHRRAARDATGHSPSLLTQAGAAANARMCRDIKADPLVIELRQAGVLDRVECEVFPAEQEGLAEATSDPRWSAPLQRAWPYFIMGTSESWLRLLDEHARRLGGEEPVRTLPQILDFYRQVNDAVTDTWHREGHHAFLHHLNALFGYEPIDLGPDGQRRF